MGIMGRRPRGEPPPPPPTDNETEEETAARYARAGMRRLVRNPGGEAGYRRKDGTFVPAPAKAAKKEDDVPPHSARRT